MIARLFALVALVPNFSLTLAGAATESAVPEHPTFNRHVRPILSEYCFACHGPDKNTRKAGRRLDQLEAALAEQDGIRAIVPGDIDASDLVARITTEDPDDVMPPVDLHKPLSETDRATLVRWIAQGAQYESHWSYSPPRMAIPADPRGLGLSAIDALIKEALDRRRWSPAPSAPPEVLVRRLHLDLLGLPPSLEEVTSFRAAWAQDPEAAVQERVDALLASPHFGERLAIPWLDLVRYADTVGYHGDQNMAVTPYRDYVIDSFNANKRFDEFTREQLAGDLLAAALPEGPRRTELLVASGYNRLNSTSEEGGAQPKEYLVKYMTDRIRTTSTTWLAATLACAQCHDHKFDPLSMRDFYALGAYFADLEEVGVYGGNGHRPPEMIVPRAEDRPRLADIVNTLLPAAEQAFAAARPEAFARELAAWIDSLALTLPALATAAGSPAPAGGALTVLWPSADDPPPTLATHFRQHAPSLASRHQAAANFRAERDAIIARGSKSLVAKQVDPRPIRVLPRGNWMDDSGEIVEPAVPALFRSSATTPARRESRLDLANWLVSRDNPLTARVFVNRLWKQFFGTGLSKTLDEFGAQGEAPIHPELLDWLAVEFMDSGWDIKHVVRLIVTSHTYRQASALTPAQLAAGQTSEADPENRWLGHQSRFRLDAELVRDNALAISGLLVRQIGGPSARPYQPPKYYANLNFPVREYEPHTDDNQWRRGVYMHWQRTYLHPMLLAFDAPGRDECTANRDRSNTPLQALTLLNDPTFIEAARAFAARILRESGGPGTQDTARLQWAFLSAIARPPSEAESAVLLPLLRKCRTDFEANAAGTEAFLQIGIQPVPADLPPAELAAWTSVARALLNLHATVTRS
ncbi:MAG: PSD1 and planctomycete cytochrome C domain-containing protein [Verrucomicrobiales bacterium]